MGKAHGRQHQEKIVFRNAQFEMLSRGMLFPFLERLHFAILAGTRYRGATEYPPAVYPASQICGHSNVGRGGNQTFHQLRLASCQVRKDSSETLLGRKSVFPFGQWNFRYVQPDVAEPPLPLLTKGDAFQKRSNFLFRQV